MANDKDGKGGAPAPGGTDGNGQAGNDPTGAEKDNGGKGKGVIEWDALSDTVFLAERAEGPDGRRVCLVTHPNGPGLWMGTYGNAPVESGDPGYVLSDGEEVAL